MKLIRVMALVAVGVVLVGLCLAMAKTPTTVPVKRVGMVVGLKPECIAEYKTLHADSYAGSAHQVSHAELLDLFAADRWQMV